MALRIEPKPSMTAAVHDHDPRALEVARLVAGMIAAARPGVAVEHVGSSAVPGLAGKGVVDLLVAADPGEIPAITEALVGIGLQRQSGRDPFPATRPMLNGAVRFEGDLFALHVHIVPAADPEVIELRAFRDALRADPELRAGYAAEKRRIVASGTTDTNDYAIEKRRFVQDALQRILASNR
ncbi:MAG: GrpB family protein [Polyangiaceae bacterium]|nr:GrpB family protein [Polyangiaceae bacterium]